MNLKIEDDFSEIIINLNGNVETFAIIEIDQLSNSLNCFVVIEYLGESTKQILKIENFDLRWTYDKTIRRRKFEKWPIDALTYSSAVSGTAKWAAFEITPASISISETLLLFTDAVGAWDDADQSILLSNTTVTAGESITLKSINITLQDALVIDLIA